MLSREEIGARIAKLPPEQQGQAALLALKLYGLPSGLSPAHRARAKKYQFDPLGYIRDVLGWEPWGGTEEEPGQIEVIEAYKLALHQQVERESYNKGDIAPADLKWWKPGTIVENEIRVEAGHGVGKTKLASGLFSHFLDCFVPSIIYTFAPTEEQIRDLLWKEIGTDRENKDFPGVFNDLHIEIEPAHFAKGRATNDNGGTGSERVQGQHGEFLMFILDEAEGVAGFVYKAIKTMLSGGIGIVLMLANPKTRTSDFHHASKRSTCKSFRISSHSHPNVVNGYDVIPGAVKRLYVESMMDGDGNAHNVEIVQKHDSDKHTFDLPFPVLFNDAVREPGTIFLPNDEYLFRVLGIPPESGVGNTFFPSGRYEAAKKRRDEELYADWNDVRIGVDVARWGNDAGTAYSLHAGRLKRFEQMYGEDTQGYVGPIVAEAKRIWDEAPASRKPESLHIRVDGSGGYGSGPIDTLKANHDLRELYPDFQVIEVPFGALPSPEGETKYATVITQAYAESAQTLLGVRLVDPPRNLESDLTERRFVWVNRKGRQLRVLEEKDVFKKEHEGRSPDDGDGACLALAPDFCFLHLVARVPGRGKSRKQRH